MTKLAALILTHMCLISTSNSLLSARAFQVLGCGSFDGMRKHLFVCFFNYWVMWDWQTAAALRRPPASPGCG